jgi:hypothetical protein
MFALQNIFSPVAVGRGAGLFIAPAFTRLPLRLEIVFALSGVAVDDSAFQPNDAPIRAPAVIAANQPAVGSVS